jgi:hypothetical protein
MNSIESINKEKTVFKNSDINYGSTGITRQEVWDLYLEPGTT